MLHERDPSFAGVYAKRHCPVLRERDPSFARVYGASRLRGCNIELPLNAVRTGKTKNRDYNIHCVVTARQLRFDRQAGRSEGAQDFQGDDSG